MLTRLPAALAALLVLSLAAGCSDDDKKKDDASGSDPDAACAYVETGGAAKDVDLPPGDPKLTGDVTAVMKTSAGDLTVILDGKEKPCTVGSFISLAEQGYYEGSGCHRMADAPGFSFLQCGDPTGSGSGGPGYNIPDELTGQETYPAGALAMANTGQPNSGGGQFFMMSNDSDFPPNYTVFGQLDAASIKLLQAAVAKGHDAAFEPQPGGGHPNEPVKVSEIVVS